MEYQFQKELKERIKTINDDIKSTKNFFNEIESDNKNAEEIKEIKNLLNNIRLNKLRKTQLYRKEMLNQKLRNIYYSDLEKILLNEHFNNYMHPK